MNNKKWYKSGSGEYSGGQGLVIDETTGENIAVAYKVENAALVAAAPDLMDALERLVRLAPAGVSSGFNGAVYAAHAAIAKAKGE